jgi:hypothetical protein
MGSGAAVAAIQDVIGRPGIFNPQFGLTLTKTQGIALQCIKPASRFHGPNESQKTMKQNLPCSPTRATFIA